MANKWVYSFEELPLLEKEYDGSWDKIKRVLGGKGAGLAKMYSLGIPVPPGYTITTAGCNKFIALGNVFPPGMEEQCLSALKRVEELTGKVLGGTERPLLVACRSGAYMSMPGMMDTVLNIGLNDVTAQAMIKLTGDARFVYDSYRRLVQGFGTIVLNIPDEAFEEPLDEYMKEHKYAYDNELKAEDWIRITDIFKGVIKSQTGSDFPQDPYKQVELSTKAVFLSWNNKRAFDYRNVEGIPHDLGTAVNIVAMIFGNMGDEDSGTGVAFTRNPSTGNKEIYGEFLFNAQGEDVVAGIRNTLPLQALKDKLPQCFDQFIENSKRLEDYFKDMQDIEFTIEKGKLYFLQTRNAKRTGLAKIKTSVTFCKEGLIDKMTAIERVTPKDVDSLLHPMFNDSELEKAIKTGKLFAEGVNASPGAAVGRIFFDADKCKEMADQGMPVIMVRRFTKPDDVHGMIASKGLFTAEGGATSHAAVVARQFGIPCIVGASEIQIDMKNLTVKSRGILLKEGDWCSVDGTTGKIYAAKIPTKEPSLDDQKELLELLDWCDELREIEGVRENPNGPTRGLQVWANSDKADDALKARSFGAKGIGLCRTEHMFLGARSEILARFIIADEEEVKTKALNELQALQTSDFEEIFTAMTELPVIIRLLDPPLHEFLEDLVSLTEKVATSRALKIDDEKNEIMLSHVKKLHESNPMMGLRGVRLLIVKRELVKMQVSAIFNGACNAKGKGFVPIPEIMIPLVSHKGELDSLQPEIEELAAVILKERGVEMEYKFGTMLEIPRACVVSGNLAKSAQFFSFGTNDLTQMTFGFSRDDAESGFLLKYINDGILPENPFKTIDQEGVGSLMKMAVKSGREERPMMDIGICGEHGGEPKSVEFCSSIGLTYVSCSPFRVPIARLSATHAIIPLLRKMKKN